MTFLVLLWLHHTGMFTSDLHGGLLLQNNNLRCATGLSPAGSLSVSLSSLSLSLRCIFGAYRHREGGGRLHGFQLLTLGSGFDLSAAVGTRECRPHTMRAFVLAGLLTRWTITHFTNSFQLIKALPDHGWEPVSLL